MGKKIKVIFVGANPVSLCLIKAFLPLKNINIVGLLPTMSQNEALRFLDPHHLLISDNLEDLIQNHPADVIIDVTKDREIRKAILRLKAPDTMVAEDSVIQMLYHLINNKNDLSVIKELNIKLEAVFNATNEGIQIIDQEGTVIYINKAFTDISGLQPESRLGHNILEVSPKGALVEVMRTHQPVLNNINEILSTDVKGLSNGYPIIVDGEYKGAIAVFKELSDVTKMARKLEKSKEVIDYLREEIKNLTTTKYTFEDLIGCSSSFLNCVATAKRAADSDLTVLIQGESGTGKELFAQAIHNYSNRSNNSFIKINCAAIPDNLLESELFGYEKGAFTGADKTRIGKFELAHKGTIFLDEIGDMSLSLQAKLLRVLQEKEVERLGSSDSHKIDVKIIAATNRDLMQLIHDKLFRSDLFYRLNVITINIPPLRSRIEDIPVLAETLLANINRKQSKACVFSDEAAALLCRYDWPGNVREMENMLERLVFMADKATISSELLKPYLFLNPQAEPDEIVSMAEFEHQLVLKALDKYGHHYAGKKEAARKLKISLQTLYNILNRAGQ